MAQFRAGQRVIYTSEARERVGLSREVNAIVEGVHPVREGKPPVHTIGWLPTGRATVNEREIRERKSI